MLDIEKNAKRILDFTSEILLVNTQINKTKQQIQDLDNQFRTKKITNIEYRNKISLLLNKQTKEQWITSNKAHIKNLLLQTRYETAKFLSLFEQPSQPGIQKKEVLPRIVKAPKKQANIIKSSPNFYLDEGPFKEYAERLKHKAENVVEYEEYSVYKSNFYSRLSNQYMEGLSYKLITKHPVLFDRLYLSLKLSGIKMLSRTYISVILFTTLISLPLIFLISLALTFNLVLSAIIAIFATPLVSLLMFYYPSSLINQRRRKIKMDLVFAIVHMAAVAGSGAKPIKIFKLLVDSGEYRELGVELKKVINYTNLFGYNLSTALRAVSSSTPSYEFKELLNGMISTIETGGDLRTYLKDKSSDSLSAYKLDQQKHLSVLSTYSDLYTGILIAAPLLFIVTLAILEKISPELGGISISLIATVGTYLVLPLVNIGFIIFLNLTQPEI